jgi:anaerobic selenocysteine-containing dehydrogenase
MQEIDAMSLKITRRQFLKYSTGALALAGIGWRIADDPAVSSALRPSSSVATATEKFVPTVCTMCPSSCGLSVRVVNGQAVKVEGNALHPVNQGVCCPKGQASLEVLYSPERIQQPMTRASRADAWKNISWDDALALAATKLGDLRARGDAHTLALLYGETRGQMRALIQRFLAAYGSPNAIDTSDRDTQATRLAMFLTQGINDVPVYQFDGMRYLISFGGSFVESNQALLTALSGVGFLRRGTPQRGKFVVIDPRLSVSAAKADEWIPIRPGTLGAFALGMAYVIIKSNLYDVAFVRDFTFGFDDFTDADGVTHRGFKNLVLEEYTLDRVEAITGVPSGTIARLAGEFAASRPAVAMPPTGGAALASGNALASAMAIHALNALVGSIDAPGGVIVQRYPQLVELPGFTPDAIAQKGAAVERVDAAGTRDYPLALSAYSALAERILSQQPYPLNALVLCNANPVFETAEGDRFAQALDRVPFVVAFSSTLDESAAHADLILPASTSFEAWGDAYVQGTGFPGLALSQPVVAPAPAGDPRGAGDILLALAQRLGGSVAAALPFTNYQALLKYRVTGSAINWDDLVKNGAWSQMVYFNATPGSHVWNTEVIGRDRVNAPRDGRFDFFSREMFYALQNAGAAPTDRDCLPHFDLPIETANTTEFPFLLVTPETMTQPRGWNGIVPTLEEVYGLQNGVRWDSWVELNRRAAASLGIADGDLVWVESPRGRVKARAKLTEGLWANAVAMPLGPGHHTRIAWGRAAARDATIGANPLTLCAGGTEKWSGLAALTTRVKVYKA